jgi:hypothetical protein
VVEVHGCGGYLSGFEAEDVVSEDG